MQTVSWGYKIYAGIVIGLFLIPEITAVVLPLENWPFTCAPMFAHYVGEGTARYRFRFIAEYAKESRPPREISINDIGLRQIKVMRYFFGKVYGSIDPRAPWGHFPNDTQEAFEARLSRFFHGLTLQMKKKKKGKKYAKGLKGIRLEVIRLDIQNRPGEVHTVGRYSVKERRFAHGWGRR